MSTIYSDLKDINIEFPDDLFDEYLIRIGKNNNSILDYVDINKILIFIYDDFCVGKASLDNLSEVCGYLNTLLKVSDNSDLRNALSYGSELSFYIRSIKTGKETFVSETIVVLKEYVEKIRSYTEKVE